MTEKEAKDILDFLARRAGYDRFMIDQNIPGKSIASVYIYDSGCIDHLFYKDFFHVVSSNSYAKILDEMLELSKYSDIETIRKGKFLQRYSNLEQILVEMDLNKSLENSL